MAFWRDTIGGPIRAIIANPSEATAIGTVILAIATLILAIIAIVTLQRTEAITKQSERAWISPMGAVLQEPIQVDKPIRFLLLFTNTGKQPAFDLAFRSQNAVIKAPPKTDWSGFVVDKNTTCEGLDPSPGALTIYPNINAGPAGFSFRAFDSSAGINPITASKTIKDGVFTYYVRGCVSYKTFGETHHSAFCYVMFDGSAHPETSAPAVPPQVPQVPQSQTIFINCPSGFEAD